MPSGVFLGHWIPGSVFAVFGLRLMYCVLMRYYLCRKEQSRPHARKFKSTVFYPIACCSGRPVEAMVLLLYMVFVTIVELSRAFLNNIPHIRLQHASMYIPLAIATTIFILKYYKVHIMRNLEYVLIMMPWAINAKLMAHHAHSKPPVAEQLHMNIVYCYVFCVGTLAVEMVNRNSPLAALLRGSAFSLLGTWLAQVGALVVPIWGTPWPDNDDWHIMLGNLIFVWHIAFQMMVVIVLSIIALCSVRAMSLDEVSHALDKQGYADGTTDAGQDINKLKGEDYCSDGVKYQLLGTIQDE